MKIKCVHCGRNFEADNLQQNGALLGLGPDCFLKLRNGDLESRVLLWNTKDVAKDIFKQQMTDLMQSMQTEGADDSKKAAIGITAGMTAWYQSCLNFSSPSVREELLRILHECTSNGIDTVFNGIESLKKMNDEMYAKYLKHAETLYDPENGETYRELLGQITGFISPREKDVDDYLWSEFTRENSMAYPYALAGIVPQSPSEMLLASQYFKSLPRSFIHGLLGVNPDVVTHNAEFAPYPTERDLKVQSNFLSDQGLGAKQQDIYVVLLEQTLLGNAFLKTGKEDSFDRSVSDIMEAIETTDEDREVLEEALSNYRKRVGSEKMMCANIRNETKELRPRSINEYATLMKAFKDLTLSQGMVSAADPAVIAFAPLARELEESGKGSGLIIGFGNGPTEISVSRVSGISDPLQKATAIFKNKFGAKNLMDLENAVDERSYIVLVSGQKSEGAAKSKKTVAFVFEKGVLSKEISSMRSINTDKLDGSDEQKLGLVITESWEMPHDRTNTFFVANLRAEYDRSTKSSSPAHEKEIQFAETRFGRLQDSMSAHSFDLTGDWLKHKPGPNAEERSKLMTDLGSDQSLLNAFVTKLQKIYESAGIDPLERLKNSKTKV